MISPSHRRRARDFPTYRYPPFSPTLSVSIKPTPTETSEFESYIYLTAEHFGISDSGLRPPVSYCTWCSPALEAFACGVESNWIRVLPNSLPSAASSRRQGTGVWLNLVHDGMTHLFLLLDDSLTVGAVFRRDRG